jgi:hypothetical protein
VVGAVNRGRLDSAWPVGVVAFDMPSVDAQGGLWRVAAVDGRSYRTAGRTCGTGERRRPHAATWQLLVGVVDVPSIRAAVGWPRSPWPMRISSPSSVVSALVIVVPLDDLN